MTNRTQQIVWAVLAVLGAVGTLVMTIFPSLVTQEEAATLGTNVPTMVMSTMAVFSAVGAIITRLRGKQQQQEQDRMNKEQGNE